MAAAVAAAVLNITAADAAAAAVVISSGLSFFSAAAVAAAVDSAANTAGCVSPGSWPGRQKDCGPNYRAAVFLLFRKTFPPETGGPKEDKGDGLLSPPLVSLLSLAV